jgi:putative copper resistance protein D
VITALAVPPSGLAWLTLQAADMIDSGIVDAWMGGAVSKLLWQSQAGVVWWTRAALAAALVAGVLLASVRPLRWLMPTVFVIAAVQFVSGAWLSHAASSPGPYRLLHLAVHATHMLGTALWLGGLLPLAILLARAQRSRAEVDCTVACNAAIRFSTIALIAVGLIILTGITNLSLLIGNPVDAAIGRFGQVLAIKLGLFMAMLMFATVNRQLLLPDLAAANPARAIVLLKRSVCIELTFAGAILLAVGELGITPAGVYE